MGRIYILIDGGLVQDVVTDDPKLINTPIFVADGDCDEHIGSHLITIGGTTYAADVSEQTPRLTKITVKPNPEFQDGA
jgi:hypothetical protein